MLKWFSKIAAETNREAIWIILIAILTLKCIFAEVCPENFMMQMLVGAMFADLMNQTINDTVKKIKNDKNQDERRFNQ